jgi:hypothetical protein
MGSVPDLWFTAQIALASKGSARSAWLLPGTVQAVSPQEAALRTGPLEVADSLASGVEFVEFKDGLLSIKARQSPWTEVLNAVREKTGIRFNYSLPLAASVTASFTALPVKQALERLFGPEASFMFRYPEGRLRSLAVPQEVWVLGKVQGGGSEPRKTGGGEDKAADKDPSVRGGCRASPGQPAGGRRDRTSAAGPEGPGPGRADHGG